MGVHPDDGAVAAPTFRPVAALGARDVTVILLLNSPNQPIWPSCLRPLIAWKSPTAACAVVIDANVR